MKPIEVPRGRKMNEMDKRASHNGIRDDNFYSDNELESVTLNGQVTSYSFHHAFSSRSERLDNGASKITCTAPTVKQHSERILRELYGGDPALDTMASKKNCKRGDSINIHGKQGKRPIVYVLAGSDRTETAQRRALVTSPITVTTTSRSPDIFNRDMESFAANTIMCCTDLTSFTPILPKKRQRVESQ